MRKLLIWGCVLGVVIGVTLVPSRNGGATAGGLCAADGAPGAYAAAAVSPSPALVTGYYDCSLQGNGAIRQGIEFGVAGIEATNPGVFVISQAEVGQEDATCADIAIKLSELARSLGCLIKPADVSYGLDLRFICEGNSSAMIHVMGELGRFVITR